MFRPARQNRPRRCTYPWGTAARVPREVAFHAALTPSPPARAWDTPPARSPGIRGCARLFAPPSSSRMHRSTGACGPNRRSAAPARRAQTAPHQAYRIAPAALAKSILAVLQRLPQARPRNNAARREPQDIVFVGASYPKYWGDCNGEVWPSQARRRPEARRRGKRTRGSARAGRAEAGRPVRRPPAIGKGCSRAAGKVPRGRGQPRRSRRIRLEVSQRPPPIFDISS